MDRLSEDGHQSLLLSAVVQTKHRRGDLRLALTSVKAIVPKVNPWKHRSVVRTHASPSGIPFFRYAHLRAIFIAASAASDPVTIVVTESYPKIYNVECQYWETPKWPSANVCAITYFAQLLCQSYIIRIYPASVDNRSFKHLLECRYHDPRIRMACVADGVHGHEVDIFLAIRIRDFGIFSRVDDNLSGCVSSFLVTFGSVSAGKMPAWYTYWQCPKSTTYVVSPPLDCISCSESQS